MLARSRAIVLLGGAIALAPLTAGCDKLGLGGSKADGGTASGGGSGGGLFSFLDKSFEGEVTMVASGKAALGARAAAHAGGNANAPKTLLFGLKPPKMRLDLAPDAASGDPMLSQGIALIVDPPTKKAYALLVAQKKAIVLDLDKAHGGLKLPSVPGAPGQASPSAPPSDPPKVEKTGKTDTVAGYQCEIWKITSKTSHADACLAEGIKWVDLSDLGVQSPEYAAFAAVSDFNHFPLRMVGYDASNVETSRMEATKIEKKKLDDTHFAVPADFQVVDLAQMLGAFGAPGGAPGAVPPGGRPRPGLPPGFVIPPVPTAKPH